MNKLYQTVDQTIVRLESEIPLPKGFFDALITEDDWSFIVKCHALLESACSLLLTSYFNNPNYKDIFSRLEMSDKKKGKVAFLRAARLVDQKEAIFINSLSELRNKVIHDIRGVAFSFSDYISSLDNKQRQSFAKSFGYAYLKYDENDKLILKDTDTVFRDPKITVFNGVKLILAIIKLQVETRTFERDAEEYKKASDQWVKSLINESTNTPNIQGSLLPNVK